MRGIYTLQGVVKHYDWGGYNFIPALLESGNEEKKPFAEYWLGTHELGKGKVQMTDNDSLLLASITGNLSYLLKVLDVRDMLSIQVHPTKEAAMAAFVDEDSRGIPLDSPQRNYKDDNHKPELAAALGEFWLLHGFKPQEELVNILQNVVELRELLPVFNTAGYGGLYRYIMEMPQTEVNRILQPLLTNIESVYKDAVPDKYDEGFWVQRAAATYNKDGNIDRGIFSIYMFNLVHLKPGEGIYQAAGVPHAYLEGQNVEIMANSDNVLRGGLTTKHIDVKELLKHVKCEATHPNIVGAALQPGEVFQYPVPVTDFSLSVTPLSAGTSISFICKRNELLLLTEGEATFSDGDHEITLRKGSPSALVVAGTTVRATVKSGGRLFRASGM